MMQLNIVCAQCGMPLQLEAYAEPLQPALLAIHWLQHLSRSELTGQHARIAQQHDRETACMMFLVSGWTSMVTICVISSLWT